MQITVTYHGFLRDVAGTGAEELQIEDPVTVLAVLTRAGLVHPALADLLFLADGSPASYVQVLVRGRPDARNRGGQPLQAGDEVCLLPALSGG